MTVNKLIYPAKDNAVQEKINEIIDQGYATETWVTNQGYALASSLATVATSGLYSDLTGIPTVDQTFDDTSANAQSGVAIKGILDTKQNALTSSNAGNCIQIISGGGVGTLPQEYQEVKYIESTGTQYIDTGITITNDTGAYADFQFTSSINGAVLGALTLNVARFIPITINQTYGYRSFIGIAAEDALILSSATDLNRHTVEFNISGRDVKFDDVSKGTVGTIGSDNISIYIFARHYSGSADLKASVRLYSLTLFRAGDIIASYIPCYRKSDNVIGLYETINGTFLTNSGTGKFLAGPAVFRDAIINFVNTAGYITGINSTDVTTALGYTPYNSTNPNGYITNAALNGYATESFVTSQGYITGITSSDVITALGYTPYNSTNPNGYITSSSLSGYATETWVTNQGYALASSLATVATSGDYTDLLNKPTIPAAQIQSDWNQTDSDAVDYIKNKPTIPSGVIVDQTYDSTSTNAQSGVAIAGILDTKQNALTSSNAGNCIEIISGGDRELPPEYQEVEYIESTGTQWIDTGYKPNQDTKVELVTMVTSLPTGSGVDLLGARIAYTNSQYQLIFWKTGTYNQILEFRYGANDYTKVATIALQIGIKYTIESSSNGLYVSGILSHTVNSATFQCTYNMYLFGYNAGGTLNSPTSMRIYSCQIYDGNTLVRDFVPCYRKSDNEIGLYDLVNDVFYTNSGTGSFVTGQAVPKNTIINFVNDAGYITGIDSTDVTTALGYTPYNSTNPNGYITSSSLSGYATETWVGQQGYALASSLATVATSGSYNDLSNKPTIPSAQVNSDWDAVSGVAQILNKPSLGTMASESASDYTPTSGLATVATTGDYDDLINKPTIPSISNLADKDLSNLSVTGQNIADTVKDQNTVNTRLKFWSGTQAEYDDLVVNDEIDDDTYYTTPEDDISDVLLSVLSAMFPVGALYIGTMNTCPLQTLGVGTWTLVAQDRVLQGAGTRGNVGTTLNQSLPNIKGVAGQGDCAFATYNETRSGAFYTTNTNSRPMQLSRESVTNTRGDLGFDASRSSSTYKDNAPVQQNAYLVNIWERTT